MISLTSVHKRFGKNAVLNGIDLTIREGRVVSMLGPNGSGKSTLLKCVLDLVHPTSGKILIDGISSKNYQSRMPISYMPQVARFAENISATQLIRLISDLRGVHPDPSLLIDYFDLSPHLGKALGELSGGTRQKVSAMLAFLYDSDIIILDEPTVGLDPISRVRFKELVLNEKEKGKTIFFTSHIMSDVEEVADDLIFLLDGKIEYEGSPAYLKSSTSEGTLEKAIATFIAQKADR